MKPARLALEDGTVYHGRSFGANGEISAEVVFNTSMTGYQEIITDPSYRGQIVVMTAPLIGNSGVTPDDVESVRPWIDGLVVREISRVRSNFRSTLELDAWLREQGILAMDGIDTRAVTRRLRVDGAMTGILSTHDSDDASLVEAARSAARLEDKDLVREVTGAGVRSWNGWTVGGGDWAADAPPARYRVAALDYGIKHNILRSLVLNGCDVTVFPATAGPDAVLLMEPDGILLSNGPGNPENAGYAVDTLSHLIRKTDIPIFGICLGHQLMSLAVGAKTSKLKFGHHGANHPVKNLATERIEITSQNHGFTVDPDGLEGLGLEVTHVNLNDGTVEGIRMKNRAAFGVQYHPEASPGPHDAAYRFGDFTALMDASA